MSKSNFSRPLQIVLAPVLIAGLLALALVQSRRQLLRSLSLVGLVLLMTYKTVHSLSPSYLSEVIIPYIPPCVLRFQTSGLRIHIVLPKRDNLFILINITFLCLLH